MYMNICIYIYLTFHLKGQKSTSVCEESLRQMSFFKQSGVTCSFFQLVLRLNQPLNYISNCYEYLFKYKNMRFQLKL